MSPDGDFVLDRIDGVIVCGGCSGHAFKFGPLLGRLIADLAQGRPLPRRGRPVPRVPAGAGVSLVIAEQVRGRERTATEVLDEHLEKLAADELGAVWRVTEERARREAAAVDRALAEGRDPGPLAGVPVGWKDLIDTGGITTTYGSSLFRDHVPDRDADVVARFAAAGRGDGREARHPRAGMGDDQPEPALRLVQEPARPDPRAGRLERRLGAPRWPRAWSPPRPAPTPAARSAARRRAAASSA